MVSLNPVDYWPSTNITRQRLVVQLVFLTLWVSDSGPVVSSNPVDYWPSTNITRQRLVIQLVFLALWVSDSGPVVSSNPVDNWPSNNITGWSRGYFKHCMLLTSANTTGLRLEVQLAFLALWIAGPELT